MHRIAVGARLLVTVAAIAASAAALRQTAETRTGRTAPQRLAPIAVDYPAEGSIFPPEFPPPTFLWRDPESKAAVWRVDVSFADGSAGIHTASKGERIRIGEIDPRCVSDTNKLPALTPRQAAAHTWVPEAALWEALKKHSSNAATVTFTGLSGTNPDLAVSRGRVSIRTSNDPVGAPIFYRDVPLMPTETETGVVNPIAQHAVRLIRWRLRDVGQPRSRVVMENVPMCANCHSFSADGKTMGMDLDGLQHNRGMYTLTPVGPETSIGNNNVIQWSTAGGRLKGELRVGFMSQVSPRGQYVVTTIDPLADAAARQPAPGHSGSPEPRSNYYVSNFKDYRFLQVFYPTRGILCWYSRATGILTPLPGADDPRFVQTNAVWSPDGRFLVFARAGAEEPNPGGARPARYANDPNERQIRYDLFRIPFNEGRGGTPEPIAGASANGMSNTFPKVSPDGRWIVFVKCRNGLLMRPDSLLYMVPAAGGQARRMRCNTSLMNSWHSFSPNGRWMVFSSKSRSPYTQMYLTHIDPDGNDSPAILIENTTAANRAVNIPEFVNVAPDGLMNIGGPAIEYYRLVDRAISLRKDERYEESAAEWRKVLEIRGNDALAHNSLGMLLLLTGHPDEAVAHVRKAVEIRLRGALESDPSHVPSYLDLGRVLLQTGRVDEAIADFRKAVELDPVSAPAHSDLAGALAAKGRLDEALVELRAALESDSGYAPAYRNLGLVLARRGETDEAIGKLARALQLDPGYAEVHADLGNVLYAAGRTVEALAQWRAGIQSLPNDAATLRRAAWVLATCPEASVRNGKEALKFALRAQSLSGGKDAMILDSLAAAYAECGRFADAVATARKALDLASDKDQRAALLDRLELYKAGKPFREVRSSLSGSP